MFSKLRNPEKRKKVKKKMGKTQKCAVQGKIIKTKEINYEKCEKGKNAK